eukprot:3526976-Karenia_brevis.AAC.1
MEPTRPNALGYTISAESCPSAAPTLSFFRTTLHGFRAGLRGFRAGLSGFRAGLRGFRAGAP